MRLAELTWPDVEAQPPVLVVPLGSCEQHGPHLPLGTDTIVAEALAGRLVAHRTGTALTPALTITASGEHVGFPGTLSVGTAATEETIVELVRSADWSAGAVLVNGHGGNRDAVDAASSRLRAEGRRVLAWWPTPDDADAHAGRTETSIMLALRPDLVRLERAVPGETAPLDQLMSRLRSSGVATVSRTGVLGDPTGATAAEGGAIVRALTDDLVASFDRWIASR